MIYVDRNVSRRLERAEAMANARFTEARARFKPEVGAQWIDVGGTYAMFDGVGSPCTQTFGLGLFSDVNEADLDSIERFFSERGSDVFHEVSPLGDPAILPTLSGRGYVPIELSSVLCRELGIKMTDIKRRETSVTTRVIGDSEIDTWAAISAAGWATEDESLGEMMLGFGRISARCEGAHPFIAELDGEPVATGGLFIHNDTAVLAGASTIPSARNRGAQNTLLYDRLRFAAQRGCTIASMATLPGSQSQINAQKNGFAIAYTRIKWHLPMG